MDVFFHRFLFALAGESVKLFCHQGAKPQSYFIFFLIGNL
jgi:hypothetical protein